MNARTLTMFALVAALGLMAGIGVAWLGRPEPPAVGLSGATVGDVRPDFRHGSLDGQWVSAADFDGQLMLVNFWATWCAPCRREMPLLQEASQAHADQLVVIGIAIDDPGPVRDFVTELGISYPILVGAGDVMRTQRAWGNSAGALPYTVLVDRDGIIRWQHLGEVTAEELRALLQQWL
ncbi:MAG: TlpA family protein disulfide reductase [Wenzhouxiangella sp.]|nr:TlpA family protein disulfide reductase [Wenzhouxiangella sp.]TVR95241.1 MAG: TlpA family protein disulfide reductase [Wenzhouxiangellaceae bacterium]